MALTGRGGAIVASRPMTCGPGRQCAKKNEEKKKGAETAARGELPATTTVGRRHPAWGGVPGRAVAVHGAGRRV